MLQISQIQKALFIFSQVAKLSTKKLQEKKCNAYYPKSDIDHRVVKTIKNCCAMLLRTKL